uniref:T-cell surface antigen CD2-like n=1 Tax=Fundulus heteroclitus TaxID=8078 RepID=A0A3Q2PUD2_FUNHE
MRSIASHGKLGVILPWKWMTVTSHPIVILEVNDSLEIHINFILSLRRKTTFSVMFVERGHLNNRTGEMTITNLTYEDSQVYTTEIDGAVINHNIHLHVISPVPVPTITSSCSLDSSTCTLTCEGDTTRAGPVNYTWMFDSVVVPHYTATYIIKEDSSAVKEFKCKMENLVSEETSKTFFNLLEHGEQVESGPKISTGVTVFVVLLVAVVVLVIVHRLKAGEFFFNKSSFPWQGDFWRNTKGHIPVDSNGSTSPPPEAESLKD